MNDLVEKGTAVSGRPVWTGLAGRGIVLAISRADRSFRSWLEKYDPMKHLDPARFYPTNRHAAQAFREEPEGGRGAR